MPDVPFSPLVPEVPLAPLVPFVPDKPEVPLVPEVPVPPPPDVNPVIDTVTPSFLYKSNVVVDEKYVPPVTYMSVAEEYFLHLAFGLVTPLTPSIVEPVQVSINV